jgi:quercetin dioxygenase-like cupin family protein
VQYVRLFAAPDGESHFEDVDVALIPVDFVPPAPPLALSEWKSAERVGFIGGLPGWRGDPHPTPRRQFFVWLAGHTGAQASDGEIRILHPGDVALVEDTTGKGHTSWTEGDEPTTVFVVQLPD